MYFHYQIRSAGGDGYLRVIDTSGVPPPGICYLKIAERYFLRQNDTVRNFRERGRDLRKRGRFASQGGQDAIYLAFEITGIASEHGFGGGYRPAYDLFRRTHPSGEL